MFLWKHTYLLEVVDALLLVELDGTVLGDLSAVVPGQDAVHGVGAARHYVLQHVYVALHRRQVR